MGRAQSNAYMDDGEMTPKSARENEMNSFVEKVRRASISPAPEDDNRSTRPQTADVSKANSNNNSGDKDSKKPRSMSDEVGGMGTGTPRGS